MFAAGAGAAPDVEAECEHAVVS
ncbi:MAG: hypothetical protein JWO39_687, partial [Gemmatimonadetes bacterium]|nr:hypothetical protein [Gemmatimonadota bacterium]